jgi:hypothetical protein
MYVVSVLSECYICCSDYTHMLQAYVSICFTFVSVCCSKCCSPCDLTREHTRVARPQPALSISVMRATSHNWTCTHGAISAQTAEHSLVKVHACMHIAKAGQRPTDAELGALHHQATPTMQHVARSTYSTCAVLPLSLM